jgi:hypothetical protein
MSSALRTVSQIEPTVKFLRATGTVVAATNTQMDTFLASPRVVVENRNGINTIAYATSDAPTSGTHTTYTLVRDLGRRVTIVSEATGNAHRQVWIQVQGVNGPTTEGVPGDAEYGTFWIRTYIDTNAAVAGAWVRLG